jgi:RimJ/RimL family protein N-acetyltransferase
VDALFFMTVQMSHTPEFTIFEASLPLLDAYIDLLEEAAAWLWARGVHQWQPGGHRAARADLLAKLDRGALILAERDGRLAGGCLLIEIAPACWPDAPADALYLSGLVVERWVAGQDLGGRILDGAILVAQRRGKARVRLDCWDGNEFLKRYYRARGFHDLGRAQEADYWVRLFERMAFRA